MAKRPLLIFFLLSVLSASPQINCKDLCYNIDSLAMINNTVYTGQCVEYTRKSIIKNYYKAGELDSLVYFDKKGRMRSVETFAGEFSTYKGFYKNGLLRVSINFKNGGHFGFWREYYENGKIRYEAEYADNREIKDDTYYTWDKQGQKYMHTYVETVREKKRRKLLFHSSVGRQKKIKVKDPA